MNCLFSPFYYLIFSFLSIFLPEESGSLSKNQDFTDLVVDKEIKISGDTAFGNVSVEAGGTLILNGTLRVDHLVIKSSGALTHDSRFLSGLNIICSGEIVIEKGGMIDVNGKGLLAGFGRQMGETYNENGEIIRGVGFGNNRINPGFGGAGGSHGGLGGSTHATVLVAPVYGDVILPDKLGSGGGGSPCGGCDDWGGSGGGRISLGCKNLINNGAISANGALPPRSVGGGGGSLNNGGAGSGGSILIQGERVSGMGTISANGGEVLRRVFYINGGGGGGRIAIAAKSIELFQENITAFGGKHIEKDGFNSPGSAGTIYLKNEDNPQGILIIKNNDALCEVFTPLKTNQDTFNQLIVTGRGRLKIVQLKFNSANIEVLDSINLNLGTIAFGQNKSLNIHKGKSLAIVARNQSIIQFDSASTLGNVDIILSHSQLTTNTNIDLNRINSLILADQSKVSIGAGAVLRLDRFSPENIKSGEVWISAHGQLDIQNQSMEIGSGVTVIKDGKLGSVDYIDNLKVLNNGILTNSDRLLNGLNLNARKITLKKGGQINLNEKGLRGGDRNSIFGKRGEVFSPEGNIIANTGKLGFYPSGASHGGRGGISLDQDIPNSTYGDPQHPMFLGSGGNALTHNEFTGGNGGGRLSLQSDTLIVDGLISVNGGKTKKGQLTLALGGAGGSGGSIYIKSNLITGTGKISADGGEGFYHSPELNSGSGGAGRVAIFAEQPRFPIDSVSVTSPGKFEIRGEDGTIVYDRPESPANLEVRVSQREISRLDFTHHIKIDILNKGNKAAYDVILLLDLLNWQPHLKITQVSDQGEVLDTIIVDEMLIGTSNQAKVPLWINTIEGNSKVSLRLDVISLSGLPGHTDLECNVTLIEHANSDYGYTGNFNFIETSNLYDLVLNSYIDLKSGSTGILADYSHESYLNNIKRFLKDYIKVNDKNPIHIQQVILKYYELTTKHPINNAVKKHLFELIFTNVEQLGQDEYFPEDEEELIPIQARSTIYDPVSQNKLKPAVDCGNFDPENKKLISQLPLRIDGKFSGLVSEKRRRTCGVRDKETGKEIPLNRKETICKGTFICYDYHNSWDITTVSEQDRYNENSDWHTGKIPVYPIFKGVVSNTDPYGDNQVVCIKNEDLGLEACYLHLYNHPTKKVKKNDKIEDFNQVIGFVGATGTNQTHLHVQVRYKGKLINPNCLYKKKDIYPKSYDYTDAVDWSAENRRCYSTNGRTSNDPNFKSSNPGHGFDQYIQGKEKNDYTIFFENDDSATLSARTVDIYDTLAKQTFDLSTFRFGSIAISDLLVPVIDTLSINQELIISPENTTEYKIKAQLKLDTIKGVVHWSFSTVDPLTYLPSADPLFGFLPPNISPPQGDGYVSYSIKPSPTVINNQKLENRGVIVFDKNEAITTNTWINTIDNQAPHSHILPIAPVITDSIFNLRWEGEDNGSGLDFVSIYMSVNQGPYELFVDSVTNNSFQVAGRMGNTYSFYSRAVDHVHNLEGKEQPDVSFKISSKLFVLVDVFPGLNPNLVSLVSDSIVPVAFYSSPGFDANDIDESSLRSGTMSIPVVNGLSESKDLDGDGDKDKISYLRFGNHFTSCGKKSVTLSGLTKIGNFFEAIDSIHLVDCSLTPGNSSRKIKLSTNRNSSRLIAEYSNFFQKQATILLYSSSGMKVFERDIFMKTDGQNVMEISKMNKGTYLGEVYSDGVLYYSAKIVIK